jgi:hypothetical protein
MGTQKGQMKEVLGLVVQVEEIFVLPRLLFSRASTKYFFFFIEHNISIPLSPSPSKLSQAGQAVVLSRLSLSVCL